jgi:excisionase family DNA binding protein
MPIDPTLTVSQAAEELGVAATTLRRWTNQGMVPFLRTPGGQRRFTHEQIREIRKQFLTVSEAARELGVSATTLRRWSNRGLVPFLRTPGRHRRFTWEQIREIQQRMRQYPVPGTQRHVA